MTVGTQRRLAAIVSADVVGYSRLMGADEAGTHTRLKTRYADLIAPMIAAHNGRVVKLMGDGLLAEFISVVDAVSWAVESQTKVAEISNEDRDDQVIEYRVGVNLGDVIVDGDDIFGDGVNIAARLQEMAEPGGVCISAKVHSEITGKIGAEFSDGGAQRAKNIARPIHIWHWSPHSEAPIVAPDIEQDAPLPLTDKPSIAVLPFDNMSSDPEHEFFGDGIAEDIITALSKISRMRVIARNSTFAYKGEAHDLRQVAGELGVRYVLEGSIRSGANRLRITAQLIDATDGSHLWAERFDRSVDDIFDIQDEITKEIVTALRVKLTDGEEALVWSRGTSDVEAWHLCVRAMELQTRFNTKDYLEARDLAEKALKLDPNYAQAWVTLGFSYWWDGRLGYTGDTEAKFVRADECAQRAMALDDTVSWSNGLSAMVAAALGRYEEGIVIAQRGVELHPGNADVRAFYAYSLFHAGNYEAAVDQYRAAMSLNPICPNWYKNGLARTLALVGEFAEALTFLDEIIESEPTHIQGWLLRAYILGQIGRMSEAKAAVKEAAMLAPDLRLGHLIGLQLIRDADALKRFADGLRAIGLPE